MSGRKEKPKPRDDDSVAAAIGGLLAHLFSIQEFSGRPKPLSSWKQHRTAGR